ncbi:hypothetical protein G5A69_00455 [Ralstonia mannitolilytica]|nr:hypothetical protein G5A69_00455 [Ralstonia mannitolilytica]
MAKLTACGYRRVGGRWNISHLTSDWTLVAREGFEDCRLTTVTRFEGFAAWLLRAAERKERPMHPAWLALLNWFIARQGGSCCIAPAKPAVRTVPSRQAGTPYRPSRADVKIHRQQWLAHKAAHPDAGRTALRGGLYAVWAWLYRNDRAWLLCHQPSNATRRGGRRSSKLEALLAPCVRVPAVPRQDRRGLLHLGTAYQVRVRLNNLILRFYQNADAGYSRARDPLSQEKRRAAKKAAPVSVEQFERLLLLSINHINLYYAKRRKLTDELRRKGINSTPARLFKAYQVAREGDRKRKLSPLEVWEKYSDWEKYSCRRGNMTRDDLTYSSEELREYYDHKIRWEYGKSIPIQVQRTRDPHFMYWRKEDGSVRLLQVSKEDARRLQDRTTWFEWELRLEADRASKAKKAQEADDDAVALHEAQQEEPVEAATPRKKSSTSEVMVSQQCMLDDALANRLFTDDLLESTKPTPTKKKAGPAKTERGTGRVEGPPAATEQQESPSASEWTADFDADVEESLADLM